MVQTILPGTEDEVVRDALEHYSEVLEQFRFLGGERQTALLAAQMADARTDFLIPYVNGEYRFSPLSEAAALLGDLANKHFERLDRRFKRAQKEVDLSQRAAYSVLSALMVQAEEGGPGSEAEQRWLAVSDQVMEIETGGTTNSTQRAEADQERRDTPAQGAGVGRGDSAAAGVPEVERADAAAD